MALKYYFEFTSHAKKPDNSDDIVVHRCEIYNDDFTGEYTQIYGDCVLYYSETDDPLEPIRGCGMTINLEANSDLTFTELYSEEERTFNVKYYRDEVILFNGWIDPEGIFEDLVNSSWEISLNCVDGIGFLQNLSYVDESTGLPFAGKQRASQIISNCLKRTKINQELLVHVDFYALNLDYDNKAPLYNIFLNADRFIKDDNETIMDCDTVLRSILDLFGAVLTLSLIHI